MHPKLVEDRMFLGYYEKWQKDPSSVVFAAISEILRSHGMIDDAVKVAKEGLKQRPNFISGRLALAKAYLARGDAALAREQALFVIGEMPNNMEAKNILQMISSGQPLATPVEPRQNPVPDDEITEEMPIELADEDNLGDDPISDGAVWHTLTMAKIFKEQGHFQKARRIYEEVLKKEPGNTEALNGLKTME